MQLEILEPIYMFQKIRTFGRDTPEFQVYFDANRSLVIELNQTKGLVIPEAYNASILN